MIKISRLAMMCFFLLNSYASVALATEWQGTVNGVRYNFNTVKDYYSSIIVINPNAFTSNPWWGKYYLASDGPVAFARAAALNLGGNYSIDTNDKSIYGPLFAFGAFQNPTDPLIKNIEAAVYSYDPNTNAEFWGAGSSYRDNKIETYVFAVESLSQ